LFWQKTPNFHRSAKAQQKGTIMPETKSTAAYLESIGVRDLPPLTCPFDPGYDPVTFEAHLEQSHHLMASMKISMACWQIADEKVTRRKIQAARRSGVPIVTGGGPFEVAVAQGALESYLDLCADIGADRIECGEGFTELDLPAEKIIAMAHSRGLEVQFELGEKHSGAFTEEAIQELIDQGKHWLDKGAMELVIEARESAKGVGLFDDEGNFNAGFADRFANTFGLGLLTYEAPNKPSQFTLLNHFGPMVRLSNVRLEEVLRVEIYRRGLHSDAFRRQNLRPVRRTEGHLVGSA
jgi:phosphosulfolactate synthase